MPVTKLYNQQNHGRFQKLKWENMAFIFLNRYIDLADAIDEGNGEIMESEFFNETDIPNEISLPSTKYLSVSRAVFGLERRSQVLSVASLT